MLVFNSRLVRYFAAGTFATLVQFASLVVLVELLHISEIVAVVEAFSTGVVVNYGLQRRFTFRSATSHSNAALRFFAIAVLSAMVNSTLFGLLNAYLSYILAQFIATFALFLINYELNRKFTFRVTT